MTIDNAPAIKAYAEERIRQLRTLYPALESVPRCTPVAWRIDELERIITLCDGLIKQAELLSGAIGKYLPT